MSRRGGTLVELLMVLAAGSPLLAAAAVALTAAQRQARAAAEVRAARAELRDVAALLASELRGVARLDTLRLTADTALEFFAPVLAAVTCARSSDGRLRLAGLPPRRARVLAVTPDTGDIAWIWHADTAAPPGRWVRSTIAAYAEPLSSDCDPDLAPASGRGRVLTLPTAADVIEAGAPVHVVRRVRYSVYRASDGTWHLGYRRCDALGPSRCQAIQPVAGPLRARSGGVAGIGFRFADSTGAELFSTATEVATGVAFVVRADTSRSASRAPGRTALDDSITAFISFRNGL